MQNRVIAWFLFCNLVPACNKSSCHSFSIKWSCSLLIAWLLLFLGKDGPLVKLNSFKPSHKYHLLYATFFFFNIKCILFPWSTWSSYGSNLQSATTTACEEPKEAVHQSFSLKKINCRIFSDDFSFCGQHMMP